MEPLEGIVVLDASWGAPGSIMTMLLADNGADVIKIDRPGKRVDPLLRLAWERGKRSIELDVRQQEDRKLLCGLLEKADIFVDSFAPGRGAELGLDYQTLRLSFPRLIHASITGYGFEGPWRDEPGYDCLLAAKLGLMAEQASAGRDGPIFLGHPHICYGTGFMAAITALAALRARHETGRGQFVDVSMLDGLLAQSPMHKWWNEKNISFQDTTSDGKRTFTRQRIITAAFECGDGEYIHIHTGGQGGFRSVMEIFGFGDIVQIPQGRDMALPLSDEEVIIARDYIPEAFKTKPRAEWLALFEAADIATLPILRQGEVLMDEQVVFAGRVSKVEHPVLRELRQGGKPLIFEKSPTSAAAPAPWPGRDNEDVRRFAAAPPRARLGEPASHTLDHPLDGIRILDFSSYFAGPYAAKILSDLGADVIQIEPPGGDQLRPFPNPFDAAQRGKRNIVLDLKTVEARAIIRDLVPTADVVIHNLRPGKAELLEIDYKSLSRINPRLIYCYLPGFGSSGPRALRKSFAPLQSGFTGLLYEAAGEGNPPVRTIEGNEDYYNGFSAALAVLAGLEHRTKTGEGQYIESPQLHSGLFTSSHHFLGPNGESHSALMLDGEQRGWSPLYGLYRTSDDWICIACVGDGAFARLAEAVDLPADLIARCATEEGREVNRGALGETLEARFAALTSRQAYTALREMRVACEIPAKQPFMPKLFWEGWAVETGRVFDHPESLHGHIRAVGLCMRLSDTPARQRGPACRLGQHTREILAEIGYPNDRIDQLCRTGAVFADPGKA